MSTHALIIDDDPAIRETLSARLESLGHAFDQATSQEEGEELLRDKRFDYVLLDLELPLRRGRPASLEAGKNHDPHRSRGLCGGTRHTKRSER